MEVVFSVFECVGEIQSTYLTENQYNLVGNKLFFRNIGINPSGIFHTTYTPPRKFQAGLHLPIADSWACFTNQWLAQKFQSFWELLLKNDSQASGRMWWQHHLYWRKINIWGVGDRFLHILAYIHSSFGRWSSERLTCILCVDGVST